jgi:hypothetical protein
LWFPGNLLATFRGWYLRRLRGRHSYFPAAWKSLFALKMTRANLKKVIVFQIRQGASTMEWVAPQHEEINLNCEVSSYANAEL